MSVARGWVRISTAGLPEQVRIDRYDEIASDLYEQFAEADDVAGARRSVRRAAVGRTVRGAVDDLVWRREVGRDMSSRSLRAVVSQTWWAPIAALVVVYDVGLAAAILADEQSTMPGRIGGPALVLVAALALAVGLAVRLDITPAAARGRATVVGAAVALTLAVAAVAGMGGPAVLLVAALTAVVALAVVIRGAVRTSLTADVLVLLGRCRR